jgi:hypothetical protein
MPDTVRLVRFLPCPVCQANGIVQMPDNWQEQVEAGAAIDIVGCGNPWHYRFSEEEQATAILRAVRPRRIAPCYDGRRHRWFRYLADGPTGERHCDRCKRTYSDVCGRGTTSGRRESWDGQTLPDGRGPM